VVLPGGKIVDSMAGGEKALNGLLKRLEAENYDGYIRTTRTRNEDSFEGFMVLKNGSAKISLYFGDGELRGERALRQIITDSLDEDCVIDVGSYSYGSSSIRVGHIINRFPA
jgi:hypothetical protein